MLTLTLITLFLFAIAVWWDFRAFTIPNWLTLLFFCIGIFANFVLFGALQAAIAFATGFGVLVIMFPLFAFRLIGAGDVKLMMAVGAIMGTLPTFLTLVWGIIFGSVLAILFGAFKTGVSGVAKTFKRYYHCLIIRTYFKPDADELGAISVPYAPALALGFIYTCYSTPELSRALRALFTSLEYWV
ncbi:A24 family peptidase [Alteromonas ponticola]|uniref:A24 family peptidase n=1 Tax=Alteromonas aquimaris TaxID=2998417 RepID=A0ABT3P9A4_9ALTE|nr:A24 family peptidase [Alteromonas aquimaris]MCW8109363.1 A24 family peptidase [Alteromonas aquimaris]